VCAVTVSLSALAYAVTWPSPITIGDVPHC